MECRESWKGRGHRGEGGTGVGRASAPHWPTSRSEEVGVTKTGGIDGGRTEGLGAAEEPRRLRPRCDLQAKSEGGEE